jgi:phage tail sheath protein FI
VLSTGNDDRTNITDTQWLNALNLFTFDMGPGQVVAPGRTSTAGHTQLISHAEARNRVALLDLTDSASSSTLIANVGTSRFAAAFAPWLQIPGLVAGAPRTVPMSALVAGLIARNDPSLGTNHAAAGRFGLSNYGIGVSQAAWDDPTRQTLNSSGVNVVRLLNGSVTVFGWRSTTNAVSDPNWIDFGNSRQYMKLSAELNQVGQNYLFETIDGQQGKTVGGFHDALAGVLLAHYVAGELFGDTPDAAFFVDTGPTVNTLARIAALELHAVCSVKMSPFAEHVVIQIVKRSIQEV